MRYVVFVNDNFHYMDESERYRHGEFATCEEAIDACQKIADKYLESAYKPGMTAAELYKSYTSFGDDPFIQTDDEPCGFSAWTYAQSRCQAIIDRQSSQGGAPLL